MTENPTTRSIPGTPRLPLLPAERPGTGLCCEAQSDGVPCPDTASDCPTCGRARKAEALPELDGVLMSDGLWPYSV